MVSFNLNDILTDLVSKYSHTGELELQHMNWVGGGGLCTIQSILEPMHLTSVLSSYYGIRL